MVHINYEHINRPAPEGTFGGEICMCPDCRSRERKVAVKPEEKKSKKVTLEQLDEAKKDCRMKKEAFEAAAANLQYATLCYRSLLKRASATVVKQHTLEK